MELRTIYTKANILSGRALLSAIVLIGAVTGGNLWLHSGDPALGYARYVGYGLSFDYSQRMRLVEMGLGGGPVFEATGNVQASWQDEGLEQFGVIWVSPEGLPTYMDRTPEDALDYIFTIIEMSGTRISEKGALSTMAHDGHEMAYQTFTLLESGFAIPGIIGAWYCEESGKFLFLYAIHIPDLNHPENLSAELEQIWQGHLDSLTCHAQQ